MDDATAAAATARQCAVAAIRARSTAVVGSWLKDSDCLQLALAATMRSAPDIMEFMFNRVVAKTALASAKAIAVTDEEWAALFGSIARPTRGLLMEKTTEEGTFVEYIARLQNALRCTIGERAQSAVWSRSWSKAACLLAMHVELHEEYLSICLGNVVRGDSRRLEDLRAELDDDGTEVMLVSQVIQSLSESVT